MWMHGILTANIYKTRDLVGCGRMRLHATTNLYKIRMFVIGRHMRLFNRE